MSRAGRLVTLSGAAVFLVLALLGIAKTVAVLAACAALFVGLPLWAVGAVAERRRLR